MKKGFIFLLISSFIVISGCDTGGDDPGGGGGGTTDPLAGFSEAQKTLIKDIINFTNNTASAKDWALKEVKEDGNDVTQAWSGLEIKFSVPSPSVGQLNFAISGIPPGAQGDSFRKVVPASGYLKFVDLNTTSNIERYVGGAKDANFTSGTVVASATEVTIGFTVPSSRAPGYAIGTPEGTWTFKVQPK